LGGTIVTLPGLVAANNLSDVVDRERAWDNLGSSVSTNIPIPSPSLDLNFASNNSLVDDISGNNLITFSRASTGTFVGSNGLIQTAASGAPRFDHNPTTGESLGLLVEESRTNNLLYSEQFDNPYWLKDKAAVTSNAATAPDGTLTADLAYTTTSGFAIVYRGGGAVSSAPYTTTIYLKSAGFTWAFVYAAQGNHYAFFNLANGTVGTQTAGITAASISPVGNGWYRCSVTQTATSLTLHVGPADANGSTTSTPSGTSGIFIWGAQLEAGSFPTSYIPTAASTITRAADVASITGTNFSSWYRQGEGTVFCQGTSVNRSDTAFWTLQGSSSNGASVLVFPNSNIATYQVLDGGTIQVNMSRTASYPAITSVKTVAGVKLNDFALAVNGGAIAADTSGTVPTVTSFVIGNYLGGGTAYDYSGTIARITYYPLRLPNLALQFITSASGSPSSTTYPYTFAIKGKDTLALNECKNASVRDFVFIKGLSAPAQPRLTTAAQQVASGAAFQDAAMLKASPTTIGNYLFSSGVTLSGVSTRINNTPALSIATSPFSGSTATASILLRELQPQANWRITEPMPSGTIASPEFAIPFETNDFLLFMKAGQN
jgi:hypothetical protein